MRRVKMRFMMMMVVVVTSVKISKDYLHNNLKKSFLSFYLSDLQESKLSV